MGVKQTRRHRAANLRSIMPQAPSRRSSRRGAMALAALSGDEQRIIFNVMCNVLDPGFAVAFSSANSELWTLTQAEREQLQADYEAAAALGLKAAGALGRTGRSCKELREAKMV